VVFVVVYDFVECVCIGVLMFFLVVCVVISCVFGLWVVVVDMFD